MLTKREFRPILEGCEVSSALQQKRALQPREKGQPIILSPNRAQSSVGALHNDLALILCYI